MFLTENDWNVVGDIDCEICDDKDGCDQVKYDCPKIDFNMNRLYNENIIKRCDI